MSADEMSADAMNADAMHSDAAQTESIETEFPDPEESHEFVLRRAARYLSQLYSRHMASVGLTAPQFTILRLIDRNGPLTMAELSQVVVLDRSTLVRAMQVLRKDGFVKSELAPGPGRRNVLTLTDFGADRLERARQIWRDAQREFEARFGVERASQLRAELFGVTGHQPKDQPEAQSKTPY